MNAAALLQLVLATVAFITAGAVAKSWSLTAQVPQFVIATLLYMVGNFIMMRLLRQVGMTTAFSLTNVLQLIILNVIGIVVFHERVGAQAGIGIVFALVGLVLITFAPNPSA